METEPVTPMAWSNACAIISFMAGLAAIAWAAAWAHAKRPFFYDFRPGIKACTRCGQQPLPFQGLEKRGDGLLCLGCASFSTKD